MTRWREVIQALWKFLEGATGENAYARYQEDAVERGEPVLTPAAFYAANVEKKYSGIGRCC